MLITQKIHQGLKLWPHLATAVYSTTAEAALGARDRRSDRHEEIEDNRLLRGAARFVDDVHLDHMAHGAFVRSPMPHAEIIGFDTSRARAAGALTVLTASDLPFTSCPGSCATGTRASATAFLNSWRPLPIIATIADAAAENATTLHPEWIGNIAASSNIITAMPQVHFRVAPTALAAGFISLVKRPYRWKPAASLPILTLNGEH